jgi:hypothetical protein
MPKLSPHYRKKKIYHQKDNWLPIDERLIPNIFQFNHVHGLARVFLEFEMAVSLVVVSVTLVAVVFKMIRLQ